MPPLQALLSYRRLQVSLFALVAQRFLAVLLGYSPFPFLVGVQHRWTPCPHNLNLGGAGILPALGLSFL